MLLVLQARALVGRVFVTKVGLATAVSFLISSPQQSHTDSMPRHLRTHHAGAGDLRTRILVGSFICSLPNSPTVVACQPGAACLKQHTQWQIRSLDRTRKLILRYQQSLTTFITLIRHQIRCGTRRPPLAGSVVWEVFLSFRCRVPCCA